MDSENSPITIKSIITWITICGAIIGSLTGVVKVYNYIESIKKEVSTAETKIIMNDIEHIKISQKNMNDKIDNFLKKQDIILASNQEIKTNIELIKLDQSITKERVSKLEN